MDYELKAGSAAITADIDVNGVITAGSGNNQITTAAGLLDVTKLSADVAYTQVDGIVGQGASSLAAGDDNRFPAGADIVDGDIGAGAAIAYSKLSIADADLTIAKTSGLQTALDGKVGLAGANTFASSQTIKGPLGLLVDYELKAGSAAITGNISASTATFTGTMILPASGITLVGAGAILAVDRAFMMVAGNGGSTTLDATTPINPGMAGQVVVIEGTNVNTVTIPASATNVKLNANTLLALGVNDTIALLYDGTNWVELYRSVNAD